MQTKDHRKRTWTVAASATGLAIIVAAMIIVFWPDGEMVLSDSEAVVSRVEGSEAVEIGHNPGEDDQASTGSEHVSEIPQEREALSPSGIFLSGRVVDKESGGPVPEFSLRMARWIDSGANPWKEFVCEKVEDPEGRLHVLLDAGGRIRLWVNSAKYQPFRTDVDVPEAGPLTDQMFELDPGITANGHVVDDTTGDPVAGAMVAHADTYYVDDLMRLALGFDSGVTHTVSDSDGQFRLSGLYKGVASPWLDGKWRIAAAHPDYAEGVVSSAPNSGEEITIRLEPGHRIFGCVLDDHGEPAANAMVCMSSTEIPLPRIVLTDSSGNYRTAPARTGVVFISVGPPPGRRGVLPNLTEETRRIKITDGDVEVNFGPSPSHITWTGTVRYRDGTPMPFATVKLAPAESTLEEKVQNRLERCEECDEEGRFEIRRMAAKSYVVEVSPSSWAHDISIGKLSFDTPGLVEQDIHIAGAEIHGIVVDKMTQLPIAKRGSVNCSVVEDRLYRRFACPIDKEGRFSLLGLPPGSHTVSSSYRGYPLKKVPGIILTEDQILRDLRIEMFLGGNMNIRIEGFAQSNVNKFRWTLGLKGNRQYTYGTQRFDVNGCWEVDWEREPGTYVTHFDFEGFGAAVREFEIVAGQTTTVLIRRDAIGPPKETVTVSGRMAHPDGSPAPEVQLHFVCHHDSGKGPGERSRSTVTSRSGEYEVTGFWSGSWYVYTTFEDGVHVDFPDLIIPPDPPAVVTLDLVLSIGEVTGKLCDGKTNRLLEKGGARWWVFLMDTKTDKVVSQIQGGQTGSSFTLKGVPAGEYMIQVVANGYKRTTTGPYRLEEGESIDVGEITLNPGGILILEVLNERGDQISDFNIICDGEAYLHGDREEVSPGRFKFSRLPDGKVIIVVIADGYVDGELTITLEPGVPAEARVILEAGQ